MIDNQRDLEIRIRRRDRDGDPSRVDVMGPADRKAEGLLRSPFSDVEVQEAIAALDSVGSTRRPPAISGPRYSRP
jgi:hypothetical protein